MAQPVPEQVESTDSDPRRRSKVKFIITMFTDYSEFERMPPDKAQAFGEGIATFNEALQKAGAWVSAEGLGAPAEGKTIRVEHGRSTIVDGALLDSPALSGFWLIEAESIGDAANWALEVPSGAGAVEVRTLVS
jgi:hypothetical protein